VDDADSLTVHRLDPPQDADIVKLLDRIARRIDTVVAVADLPDVDDEQLAVAAAAAQSIASPIRTDLRDTVMVRSPLCASADGFSLHANVAVHQNDRRALERGLRYGLRPPFSVQRLSLTAAGKVRLKLRKPTYSGQTELVLDPVDFLRRLAATIPPPRMNMVRFHGIFAPNAKARSAIKAMLPPRPAAAVSVSGPTSASKVTSASADQDATAKVLPAIASPNPVPPPYRRKWAELLKRVFDLDVVTCGRCGHKMRRISHIEQPDVIEHILGHLGLPTAAPIPAAARAPPQLCIDLDIGDDPASCHLAI
jgi:hypothetical protein